VLDITNEQNSLASASSTRSAIDLKIITVGAAGGTMTYANPTIVGGDSMDLFILSLPASMLTMMLARDQRNELDVLRQQMEEFRLFMQERRQVDYAERLSSPPQHPALKRVRAAEGKDDLDDGLPGSSGDELEKSIHIPRGVLSKWIKK